VKPCWVTGQLHNVTSTPRCSSERVGTVHAKPGDGGCNAEIARDARVQIPRSPVRAPDARRPMACPKIARETWTVHPSPARGRIERVIKTKRWNDSVEPDDGCRILVTRYRPRGVKHDDEPWDAWVPLLAPSRELHAAAYGKGCAAIGWDEYRSRYLQEMKSQTVWIRALGQRARNGETLTLLCSSACVDAQRCHRTLLQALIESVVPEPDPASSSSGRQPVIVRRKRP
jgi:uncharacterized protein YeaO (DUF488 family)